MSKVAIVTDSNSGITQKMAKELGVYVLPMSFLINGKVVREDIDITQAEFFKELEDPNVSVSTSQPAPAEVTDLWDRVLRENDEIVYIPLSSGLSNS